MVMIVSTHRERVELFEDHRQPHHRTAHFGVCVVVVYQGLEWYSEDDDISETAVFFVLKIRVEWDDDWPLVWGRGEPWR